MDTKCLHDSTPIPKKQQILNLRLSKNGKKKDLALLTWLLVSISNLFENKERLLLHGIAEGGIYKLRDLGTTVMSSSVDFKSNSCHNNHCLLTNLDVVSRNTHESSINTNKSESKSVNHFNSDVKL
ncbi:uncharacterized protein DS421_9g263180 [Arachis hypogaea]|nr:uncharacterized protein DS421_9g263180 [Arachis hypogaea]